MTKVVKESTSDNYITLDKTKINSNLASSGEYISDDIYIKKFDGDSNPNNYLATFKKEGLEYSGSINSDFQKDGYGLEIYQNGDKYFGQYESDLRNENGIYFFSPTKNELNNYIKAECYFGKWKNNLKDNNGIYIWMEEPENNFLFENANFDAYIGEFEEDKYIRGSYLTKFENEFSLYHGNFTKEGKKQDNDAFYFSSKKDSVFHGEVKNDSLLKGYLGFFDEDFEDVKKLVYCIFNEDGSINDAIEENEIKLNEEEINDEKKKLENFRNIIFDGDYFGNIYNRFTKIKNKIEKLGNITKILENENNIDEIDKLLNKYRKKNIYYNIEENFFGRDM